MNNQRKLDWPLPVPPRLWTVRDTADYLGVPVSTTHTITGAIIGVGAAQRASAVRWGVAGNIVLAWLITIPAAALVAAVTFYAGGWIF